MSFNDIGAINKIGQTSTALKFNKKDTEDSVEQSSPASKTFLSESSSQKVGVKDPYQELSDFMKMSDAQKMQYLWLRSMASRKKSLMP
ncbi:MAG TPA: hypothetical protein VK958_05070 [Methylophilus sp.]|uniref:hypothetical protein n=1 Tax=Methylophilus sp. TaxID=29541 RepID=UPI002C3AB7EB|nr:hypothetical protein [Methylophilus sp.]HSH86609.1 hypothetical protein [Methylophilus sp.]